MPHTYRNAWAVLILITTLLLLTTGRPAHAAPELAVGNYQLVSTARISRTEFDYTYKADITNTGSSALNVSAIVSIDAPGVTVLDGELSFGDIVSGATVTSADTFVIRHNRLYAFNPSALEWQTSSMPQLAPPSDPQIIEIGDGEITLEVSTQLYGGYIDASLPDQVTVDSLSVVSGIGGSVPIASDGRFSMRMNDNATGLLRVVDIQGNTILMQVFPKTEALIRTNPQINSLSTAVTLVMLQPGLLTNDPLLDALIISVLEQLPETEELSKRIAAELSQGTFALNKDYSQSIKDALGQVLYRLTTLSAAINSIDSVDDLMARSLFDKLMFHIENLASRIIKPANADNAFVTECTDSFNGNFTGHPGTMDDVCITANISAAGIQSSFDITNQRTRWMTLGVTGTNPDDFDAFKLVPPRHIDVPGATSMVKGLIKLGLNSLIDIGSVAWDAVTLNFKDIFKKDFKTEKQLSDAIDKFLSGHKTSAQFRFGQDGEYLLSSIGYSNAPLSVHSNQEKYLSGSFSLTITTEVIIPFVSALLDFSPKEVLNTESDIGYCFSQSGSYLISQIDKILRLRDKFDAGDAAEAFASYIVFDIMLEPKAWTFIGCALGDLGAFYGSLTFQTALKALIDDLGGPLAFVTKLSSGIDFAANLGLFLGVVFDKDLVSEDFYRVKVGNAVSSGSFQIGSRVELPSTAGTLIVYDVPDGNVKGIQSPGAKGTVVEETTADGSKWWHVDFDAGIDGWVTGNVLKPIGGATGTLLSSIAFTDASLGQCVLDAATANGWQTVDQVTTLSCANRAIANLAGIENLQALQTLVLSDNQISGITPLRSLTQLKQLNLSGNSGIQCTELDALAAVLTSTTMTRPADCVQSSTSSFIWPVTNFSLTQAYAAYNAIGNNKYHAGFDLAGDPAILAAAAGTVRTIPNHTFVNENHNMGNVVIIDHNNGQGPFTLYAHLASIAVANGVQVKAGDVIGTMGDTGCANLAHPCGVHLHFEVKQKGTLGNLHDDSGPYWGYTPQVPNLAGYLNPWPYLDHGWAAYAPKTVRALADQIVRTGPGTEYAVVLGNVAADQTFVATQQVGNWYEIDFPGEAGPAKGWIQAEPVSSVQRWRVTDPTPSTTIGVSVCPTASACASSPSRLSYAWNQQQLVELESAPAQNGCTKPWIRTSLLDNHSGWVCGDFLTIGTVLPIATGKLNDTGITTCSSNSQNGLPCPVSGFPGQDGEHGRDALAAAGLLQKVGGGSAGFDFTKLDASGNSLPADASEWSCVKDNHTGLIWEEKTTSGLHSMHHTYTWYNPDSSTNGGYSGVQNGGSCSGCDTHGYVQAVNAQGLCSANDWRMPTREELRSIVDYSRINPAIDTAYFRHTSSNWYWSASPSAGGVHYAWHVHFGFGLDGTFNKTDDLHVRLVRGGQ